MVFSLDNHLMQLFHIACLEGHGATQHGVEDNAGAPDVGLETPVPLFPQYLWRNVGRRATLFVHEVAWLNELAHAEVGYLDAPCSVEQDIVKFDISVEDSSLVDVA